jgi:hypothetical protein
MFRALTALVGFAAAAVLLELAPRAGNLTGSELWYVAGVWALAGLVAGVCYQAGGVRRPGLRMNSWMLIVLVPWVILSVAVITQLSNPASRVAGWARDVFPDAWLAHWTTGIAAFALVSGLLLALSVVEPRVGVPPVAARPLVPAPVVRPAPRPDPVAGDPRDAQHVAEHDDAEGVPVRESPEVVDPVSRP